MGNNRKPIELLFIERNPGNLKKLFEAFEESKFTYSMRFAGNADEAMRMILQIGEYDDIPQPDLIIADIHSYRKEAGIGVLEEVLERIANAESIKCIPTIIITSLAEEVGKLKIHDCPNLLIHKPKNLNEYTDDMKSIEEFLLKNILR